jgi:hypothetical protein
MDPDAGICSGCGYDLTGLPDIGNCPECGQTYNRHSREGVARRREAEPGLRIRTVVPLGCGSAAAGGAVVVTGILWATGQADAGLFWSAVIFGGMVVFAALAQSLGPRGP